MKKNILWKIILIAGIAVFTLPVSTAVWNVFVIGTRFTFFEWILLFSFVYWPLLLAGLVAVIFSAVMLRKNKNKL